MNELSNDELVNAGVFQPQAGNAKDLALFEDIKKLAANIQQVKAVVASLKLAVKKPYASIVLKALQVLVSTAREQAPTQAPSIVATAVAATPMIEENKLVAAGVWPPENELDRDRFVKISRIATMDQIKLALLNLSKKEKKPFSSNVLTEIYLIISDEIRNRDSSGRAMTDTEFLVYSGVLPPVNEQDDANFKEIMLITYGDALLIKDAVIDVKRTCKSPPYSSAVLLKLRETLGLSKYKENPAKPNRFIEPESFGANNANLIERNKKFQETVRRLGGNVETI